MEKGGLAGALTGAGLRRGDSLMLSDELRLGLRGETRRVLAPRGVEVTQRLQLRYEWAYLLLGVDPLAGSLKWEWIERMRQEHIRPVLEKWRLRAVVWDGAGPHRGKSLRDLPTERVLLPPYSPELNPAGRVFREVRRHVEGRVYDSLKSKKEAVEGYLDGLAADPERVERLCGWAWLTAALEELPELPAP